MKKKFLLNIGSSLLMEIVSVVCAFILPRLIMANFGSQYNGIVTSVSQFLSFVSLLRGGVGGVTRAALYKPLHERDHVKISGIVKATERFMRRVCLIFVGSLVIFAAVYPFIVREQFDWFFTFTLVLILGLSTISQYYFGITYQMLLQADQKQYIYNILSVITTILNTVASVILINLGMEFRLVKLVSAALFGISPIVLYLYVHRKYHIINSVPADTSAIRQRWDAFAHQVAAFVHNNTDVVILTLFTDLFQVAIYSVYFMVVNGVQRLVSIFSAGMESALGNLLARDERDLLMKGFRTFELAIHLLSTICYSCAAFLIVPFVMVYTKGITDTNYNQPLFGYLLCLSMLITSIRIPYHSLVNAAGHYKQTKNGAILEAVINIALSVPLVMLLGCTGVVIGTIVAVTFRTLQFAVYSHKHLLHEHLLSFIKRMGVTLLSVAVLCVPYFAFGFDQRLSNCGTYVVWFSRAALTFIIVTAITSAINAVFYRKEFKQAFQLLFKRRIKAASH